MLAAGRHANLCWSNYSYFPIMIGDDYRVSRDHLYQDLKDRNIFSRRYFYPLISDFPMYKALPSAAHANLPCARKAAGQVICIPIYAHMTDEDQARVIDVIRPR